MNKQTILKSTLCLLMAWVCNVTWAQAVIFPQETQPGTAKVNVDEANGVYSLSNDLFTANFKKADGKLTFGGCEALGLIAGSEIFKVTLGDGTEIPASEFTLEGDVVTETLTGTSKEVKAARRYHGKQIKATFTHESGLTIEWRAVLRDGSHYLRTEMDIKNPGTEGIAMNSIYPMLYTVQNVDGEKAPAVVGNTRGAVIASDKIFAGVETPTAFNMAGEATDLEKFAFKAWTGASSFAWTPEAEETPAGIKGLSQYGANTIVGSRGYVIFRKAGEQTITLQYTGQNSDGNKKLHVLGVDIVSLDGTVIGDYHYGTTGGSHSNNVYTINVPQVGAYMVRYFISTHEESVASVGKVIYSGKVSLPTLVYDLASTETPCYGPEVVVGEEEEEESALEPTFTLQDGLTYYMAANAKQSNGSYVLQYLYIDDSGALKTSTTYDESNAGYKWTLVANGNAWYVKNGHEGKYLSYTAGGIKAGDSQYSFELKNDAVMKDLGIYSLYNPTSSGGKYMVTKMDGASFNQNGTARNDGQWCSDYLFTPLAPETAGTLNANNVKDTWVQAWTGFSNWTGTLPAGVTKVGTAKSKDTGFYHVEAGILSVLFDYTSGSHGLYVLGVQVFDINGSVVAQQFKNGFTGSNSTTTYQVYVPKAGAYKVRYIADYIPNEGTVTNGDITITHNPVTKKISSDATTAAAWLDTDSRDVAANAIPAEIKALKNENGVAITQVKMSKSEYFDIKAGRLKGLYSWKSGSGNQRVNIVGVELVDLYDVVVAADYHWGWAGSAFHKNTYAMDVPQDGVYYFRYYAETNTNALNSDIDITYSMLKNLGTIDEDNTLADAWTPESWKTIAAEDVPNRINEVGCTDANARIVEQQITVKSAGALSIVFNYERSEGNRLDIAGVDLIDAYGQIVSDDYHAGYAGNQHENNTYKFNVQVPGTYTLRYFANAAGAINSYGNIALSLAVDYTLHLIAPATTPLVGKWSRQTTLAAGKTWNISAVVGVIAPGQARRSFLCYSERERAVPWRAVPAYISWYEINIDRNNANPGREHLDNMKETDCLPIVEEWKKQLYDVYGEAPYAFVWDDGWDKYGEWEFHDAFPEGFTNMDKVGRQMGAGQGAWLGPVGGYGNSGGHRRNYWTSTKTGGMQLSNPLYYDVFVKAVTGLLRDKGYDFRFFKFDGISSQFSSVGPDAGATGNENAEAIIMAEKVLRSIKEDVFLNTTVGTWASPFWFQHTDAIWRQEKDYGEIGTNSNDRENWITYRDRLVYQNFVQNSPLCPINTLMTHGFIFTNFSEPASTNRDWDAVVRELRCAFACGSGMVELYNDYELTNNLVNPATGEAGELWGEIAKCMKWQRKNADVLPDIHWVGGNPWTGAKAEVYGWAAWNGRKAVLTLRNGANDAQDYTFTLREALDIPAYVKTSITLTKAFEDQADLEGLKEGEAINIDTELTVKLPGSSVYIFDGVQKVAEEGDVVPAVTISAVIGEYKVGTFYANEAVTLPEGVKAYYVANQTPVADIEEADGTKTYTITMTKIEDGIIPAETGVVIRGEMGTYTFTGTKEEGTAVEGNLMKGYAGGADYQSVALPGNATNYVLNVKEKEGENGVKEVGFYRKDAAFKVYNHRAYLQVPNPSAQASAPVLRIRYAGEETTEVEFSTLIPQLSSEVYDLQGRRVENPTKGIYIVNGKKVIF